MLGGGGGEGDIDIRWVQRRRWVGRDDFERALVFTVTFETGYLLESAHCCPGRACKLLLFHESGTLMAEHTK